MSIADLFGNVSPDYRMYAADKAKSEDYDARIKAYQDLYDQYKSDYDVFKQGADAYNLQVADYNAALNKYKEEADAYNAAVKKFNEGDRTVAFDKTDYYVKAPGEFTLKQPTFTQTEPTAPADPGFDQAEIDAFVAESQAKARRRGMANAAALNVLGQGGNYSTAAAVQGGGATSTTPEFSFSATGFDEGGVVPPPTGYAAPVRAPAAQGLGYYIPPELKRMGQAAMGVASAIDPAQGIMRGMAASGRAFDSSLTPEQRKQAAIEAGLETAAPLGIGIVGKLAKQPIRAILMDMLTPTGATKEVLQETAEDLVLGAPASMARRNFLKGAAATAGVAAIAPDLAMEAGEAVTKATKAAAKARINPVDMFSQNIKLMRREMDEAYDAADEIYDNMEAGDLSPSLQDAYDEQLADAHKMHEYLDATTEMEMRELFTDIGPAELADAADESLEDLSQALTDFRNYTDEEYINEMVDLAEEIKKRGLIDVKNEEGVPQYPYARAVVDDVADHLSGDKTSKDIYGVYNPPAGSQMTRSTPTDVAEDIEAMKIRNMYRTMEDEILKMRDMGRTETEIEAYRTAEQARINEAQGLPSDIDDFFAEGGAVLSPREASEQMGDIEYEIEMQPYLQDPLSRLGFDPNNIRVGNPQSEDAYSAATDIVTLDPNYGMLSKETQAHEFRHRGLQKLLDDYFMLDPGQFKRLYGQDAFNLMVKVHQQQRRRGPVEDRVQERVAEMFQRPEEFYLGNVYETSDARVFQTLADAEAYAKDNPGVEFRVSEVRPNLDATLETPRAIEFRDYMINKNRGETMQQGTDAEFEAVRNIQDAASDVLAGRYANGGLVQNYEEGGVVTLKDTAVNMFRGPRGIGAYQQYAKGGAVTEAATEEQLSAMRTKVMNDYGFDPINIAMEEGVDPELFLRVMYRENKGRQGPVSEAGAIGLMQLMPGTAEELGVNPNNPVENARGGARYLKKMLSQFESVPLALAAYNAGPGNVAEYGGIPPFAETQEYVAAIAPAITGEPIQPLLDAGAENYLMAQPVMTQEAVLAQARDTSPVPQYRPFNIDYYPEPASSPRPQLRPAGFLTSDIHQQLNPALR